MYRFAFLYHAVKVSLSRIKAITFSVLGLCVQPLVMASIYLATPFYEAAHLLF